MSRRQILQAGAFGATGLAAVGVLGACAPAYVPVDQDPDWDCGIASGLHDHRAAVLWTRFAPAGADSPGSASVDVDWTVAADPGFTTIVASGTAVASPAGDGTVKVLAEGLSPATTYWYRFNVGALASPVGRTRTPPAPGTSVDRIRLAVASCQNFRAGFYPAWRDIASQDVDAVLHVGDYIYEAGGSFELFDVRADRVGSARTLTGYRAKYKLYRSDSDLRAAHAAHAFAPVWDDHEHHNDCDRTSLIKDPQRAADAYQAWFEYQPVWPIDGSRIYRRVRFGDLVDISLIDTRQYRDPEIEGVAQPALVLGEPGRGVTDPSRTILGSDQRDWLLDGFGAAQADSVRWKLIGNQVMIAPTRIIDFDEPAARTLDPTLPKHAGLYLNADGWDGFQAERDQVLRFLLDESIADVAFLTGDIHSFWQAPLQVDYDDAASPVVAQEFVCGSVSSGSVELSGIGGAFRPQFRYVDLIRRGYGLLDLTADGATVEYRTADSKSPTGAVHDGTTFDWTAGTDDLAMTPR